MDEQDYVQRSSTVYKCNNCGVLFCADLSEDVQFPRCPVCHECEGLETSLSTEDED